MVSGVVGVRRERTGRVGSIYRVLFMLSVRRWCV